MLTLGVGLAAPLAASSISCIIPDHGIVTLVDCGTRWCADAPFAKAFNQNEQAVEVQQANPDGTTGWVTHCLCMTHEQDATLQTAFPHLQYELLRDQILDATRQKCIDVAVNNGLDPDPPIGDDAALEPDCYEAVATVYRDGCCAMRSDECGGVLTCDAGGTSGQSTDAGSDDSSGSASADDTTTEGTLDSLAPYYHHIDCAGSTCIIGQPLIDALLQNPGAALAEGTSLAFHPPRAPTGLRIQGIEPGGLADQLGLHEGDHILRIDDHTVTDEASLLTAAAHAYAADEVTVILLRDATPHERRFIRMPQ